MELNKNVFRAVGAALVLFLVSLLRVSFVWGSRAFFFSGFCMCAPLLGAFFGLGALGGVLGFTKLFRFLFLGKFFCLTAGLPTVFAAWCWRSDSQNNSVTSFFLNALLPLSCFFLFIIHPSVGYGYWYGLYWFIPLGIYCLQFCKVLNRGVFWTALRSTFVAHAVGSLIWCYLVPMSPGQWCALIPIVAVERLIMAFGMAAVYRLVVGLDSVVTSHSFEKEQETVLLRFLGGN